LPVVIKFLLWLTQRRNGVEGKNNTFQDSFVFRGWIRRVLDLMPNKQDGMRTRPDFISALDEAGRLSNVLSSILHDVSTTVVKSVSIGIIPPSAINSKKRCLAFSDIDGDEGVRVMRIDLGLMMRAAGKFDKESSGKSESFASAVDALMLLLSGSSGIAGIWNSTVRSYNGDGVGDCEDDEYSECVGDGGRAGLNSPIQPIDISKLESQFTSTSGQQALIFMETMRSLQATDLWKWWCYGNPSAQGFQLSRKSMLHFCNISLNKTEAKHSSSQQRSTTSTIPCNLGKLVHSIYVQIRSEEASENRHVLYIFSRYSDLLSSPLFAGSAASLTKTMANLFQKAEEAFIQKSESCIIIPVYL
jgi:hypothetical protein